MPPPSHVTFPPPLRHSVVGAHCHGFGSEISLCVALPDIRDTDFGYQRASASADNGRWRGSGEKKKHPVFYISSLPTVHAFVSSTFHCCFLAFLLPLPFAFCVSLLSLAFVFFVYAARLFISLCIIFLPSHSLPHHIYLSIKLLRCNRSL